MPERLVCRNCGHRVTWGMGNAWQHHVGWRSEPTCGLKPEPVTQSEYDAAMAPARADLEMLEKRRQARRARG